MKGEGQNVKSGVELITAERQRQVEVEGWTPEHDDTHVSGELLRAAVHYTFQALIRREDRRRLPYGGAWPWAMAWWKPTGDPVRDLTKAGALIAAEIDRLSRAAAEVHSEVEDTLVAALRLRRQDRDFMERLRDRLRSDAHILERLAEP